MSLNKNLENSEQSWGRSSFIEGVRKISEEPFAVIDNFLPPETVNGLREEIEQLRNQNELIPAGISKSGEKISEIRNDSIAWITRDSTLSYAREWFGITEEMRAILREELFLALHETELMLAWYAPNQFYKKHLDTFRGSEKSRRIVTTVLYLNENYKPENEGCLRVYPEKSGYPETVDVEPLPGRLVLFLSEYLWHEVLPTRANRYSSAAWFVSHANQAFTSG